MTRHGVVAALLGSVLVAGTAAAEITIQAVVVEDDYIAPWGDVTLIDNVAVAANGDWLVEAFVQGTSTSFQTVVRNGSGYFRTGNLLSTPGGLVAIETIDSVRMDDRGNSYHNLYVFAPSDPNDIFQVVTRNQQVLLVTGDVTTAPELPAGTVYTSFIEVYGNDADQMLLVAKVDHPSYPVMPGQDWFDHYALIRLDLTVDSGTNQVTGWTETALLQQGDPLGGSGATLSELRYRPHCTAFNDNGDWVTRAEGLFPGDDGSLGTTHDWMIISSTGLLLEEGAESPMLGRNFQLLDTDAVDVSNDGTVLYKANLDGSFSDDEVVFVEDARFVGESDSLPAIAPYILEGVSNVNGPIYRDDFGNVLWVGNWSNPNSDNDRGLFHNYELLIEEGVTVVSGRVVVDITDGHDAHDLSDDGHYAIVQVKLDNSPQYPLEAALLIDFGPRVCRGDTNCDGEISFGDINGFVMAVIDDVFCDGTGDNADIDENGSVGFEDINPFVVLLTTNDLPIPCP